MAITVSDKDLGIVTAYGYAVSKGYTGTEEEYAELMASYADVAEDAAESASNSEAYAVGTRDGDDVESSDPAYHNNSKYYAEQAANVAESIPPDYTELSNDVTNLKSAITEKTRNLFSLDGLQIGKNAVGANFGARAISVAILVENEPYTVSCENLPANLKYEIHAYSSDDIADRVKSLTSWITSDSTVTTKTPDGTYTYIRILFGSVNDANLTESDFVGLKLQIEHGSIKTAYVEPITAVDVVARAGITGLSTKSVQKISVMQFNVGHYAYGVAEAYSGPDAEEVLLRWKKWFNENACDIANINEYYRYFTLDQTISARTTLFDPIFKYCYNNLVTSLFSRYELLGQTWGYLGASDPSSQRYYVKAYVKINGVQLCLVGCHLSPAIADAPAKRAVQIADLLTLVENDTNVIIFGDFNVKTTDEYAPFISAGYKMANGGYIGYFNTDYTQDPAVVKPLDNIIVSPNIYISNIKVHGDDYSQLTSDHYAVTCDLTIYPAS